MPAFSFARSASGRVRCHASVSCTVLRSGVIFKPSLTARAELVSAIEDYRRELVPLIVPMTLISWWNRSMCAWCASRSAVTTSW